MAETTSEGTSTQESTTKPQKKASRPKMTPEEKKEARATLLQLLLICLTAVGIVYLGFNLAVGAISFTLWVLGKMTGTI